MFFLKHLNYKLIKTLPHTACSDAFLVVNINYIIQELINTFGDVSELKPVADVVTGSKLVVKRTLFSDKHSERTENTDGLPWSRDAWSYKLTIFFNSTHCTDQFLPFAFTRPVFKRKLLRCCISRTS